MVLEARWGPILIDVILTSESVLVPTLTWASSLFRVFVKSLLERGCANSNSVTEVYLNFRYRSIYLYMGPYYMDITLAIIV